MTTIKDLYRDRYRIESTRLPGWDYAAAGYYFVTLCTADRIPCFGEIVAREMRLSILGEIADRFWSEIPRHFPNTNLDQYVIMPNHVHGILILHDQVVDVETPHVASLHVASLPHPLPSQQQSTASRQPFRKFGPLQPGSLSKVIQAYKAAVTTWARKNGHPEFAWQAGFYDHIIRDEKSLSNIQAYILANPTRWETDQNNLLNVGMG